MHHRVKIMLLKLMMIVPVLASTFIFWKSAEVEMKMSFDLAAFILSKTMFDSLTDDTELVDVFLQFDHLSHFQLFDFIFEIHSSHFLFESHQKKFLLFIIINL